MLEGKKALLVGVQTPEMAESSLIDSLNELAALAKSVGCAVTGQVIQNRPHIHPATYIGSGKLKELKTSIDETGYDLILFDSNLSPSQGENLEKAIHVMVMDRTQLILEIFRQNARTHEARIQVELAQLEYMLPRLVGMWAHLDRERGGIAGSKGAGEKQINIDRSLIRNRISRMKKELAHISRERATQKKRRENCLRVSLVGYTNAGKSTLMNRLTQAGVVAEDRLFATLDSTTRVLEQSNKPHILLSDTVGFLKQLPHQLVASFRSTLEVVRDADLLLHVVDISHPRFQENMATTENVLSEINADTIPTLVVFNKVDATDKITLGLAKKAHPQGIFLSALHQEGEGLLDQVMAFFEKSFISLPLCLDYAASGELAQLYRWARVEEVRYEPDGIHLKVTSTPANINRIRAKLPQN